ncbi:MAG: glycosyltransferase family 4 protein [Methanoregula sp.]|nr:glycosyltransferase family 4 protein [Methanoregula sp.]
MDITLLLDYSKKRTFGGPVGVAYDTVEGLKKNYRRLEKEDIHFHIMSTTGTTFHSMFEKDNKYSNISYEYFRSIVPTAITSEINYLLHIKKRREKIDLMHSHALSGAFVGTLYKIPTILTLHGMIWREKDFFPGMYSRFVFKAHMKSFEYTSRRLKKLIAISPYVIKEVNQFLKTKIPDTEVIENPVSDVFFEQEKREKEGLILYPGSIDRRKNQIDLIKALYLLKKDKIKFHCVLPGPIPDQGYFNELQELIKKYQLENDVTIPGPVPFEQLLRMYSEASIMIMTTLQETAPMVISEAMAMRTPVIAPNISGIPYMVSAGKSGFLINPDSPEEIVDKTALLLGDSTLRKQFQEESRRIAVSRWKSEVITNKLIDLYLKMM